jgi:hypothetical protein
MLVSGLLLLGHGLNLVSLYSSKFYLVTAGKWEGPCAGIMCVCIYMLYFYCVKFHDMGCGA